MTNRTKMIWGLVALMSIFPFLALAKGEGKPEGKVDVSVSASVTKTGYVGSVFVYEVFLLSSSPDISNVRVLKNPEVSQGVRLIQGVTRGSRPEKVRQKGKTYYKWTIMRNFLIPSDAGGKKVGAGRFVVFIPHEKVMYHDFWGSRRTVEYEEVAVDCKAVDFKVSDLPNNRAGLEFAGAVGDFKIEGWFPPGKISKGSEAYVVFSISGYGSLENLKLPNINRIFTNGCHLREVEQSEEQMQRDGQLYSEVTLTCRFVPDEDEFSIEPLRLGFFNPSSGKYYEAESESLHWTSQPSRKSETNQREAIEI